MIEKIIKVNDYLTLSKLPASDYVINPYIGCPHSCKYCYACFMKRFTNHPEPWGEFIDIKICDKPINLKKIHGKSVFLSSVTDCYNPFEEKYQITKKILEQLKTADCKVTISTKSALILRDLDLLKEFKNLTVAMSVNTLDESFQNAMDKASSISKRLETLKTLHENGIHTVLFISPIFPIITDFKTIIETTYQFIDTFWVENLNLRGQYKSIILKYITENYPDIYPLYDNIYNKNNKEYWLNLSTEINDYCFQNNIKFINYFYHEKIKKL